MDFEGKQLDSLSLEYYTHVISYRDKLCEWERFLSEWTEPEILVTAPEMWERVFGEWCLFSSL